MKLLRGWKPKFLLASGIAILVTLFTNCGSGFQVSTKAGAEIGFQNQSSTSNSAPVPQPSSPDVKPPPLPGVPVATPAPVPQQPPAANNNGIWIFERDLNEAALKTLVAKKIFNIYLNVGYPNSRNDPALQGIVSDTEVGVSITKNQVQTYRQLLERVDSRLRLWAWFGTWSSDGNSDADGHQKAKIDISTAAKRKVVIDNIVRIASWGFYGVQDDTEDIKDNSKGANGQFDDKMVAFLNEEAKALHAIGVKAVPFTPDGWYGFTNQYVSQITEPDYQILVPFDDMSESSYLQLVDMFIKNSSIPVLINITYRDSCPFITKRVDRLGEKANPKLIGYALYEFNEWNKDWSCWSAWHK